MMSWSIKSLLRFPVFAFCAVLPCAARIPSRRTVAIFPEKSMDASAPDDAFSSGSNKNDAEPRGSCLWSAPNVREALTTRATFPFALRGEGRCASRTRTTSARPASPHPPPSHSHSQELQWLDSHWLREDKFENNEIIADKVPGASGFASKDVFQKMRVCVNAPAVLRKRRKQTHLKCIKNHPQHICTTIRTHIFSAEF